MIHPLSNHNERRMLLRRLVGGCPLSKIDQQRFVCFVGPEKEGTRAMEQAPLALPRSRAHDADAVPPGIQCMEQAEVIEMVVRVLDDARPGRRDYRRHTLCLLCSGTAIPAHYAPTRRSRNPHPRARPKFI
ncbi:MAG: hypothetical protein JXN60_05390 [Lentisphaerae bacterium]|nr:hypothetical protein [Lentisphaerota bacterium]